MKKTIKAAFPGVHGAYSEVALRKAFRKVEERGRKVETVPRPQFKDAFIAVEEGKVDCGIVPIENSTEGSVNAVYDLFMKHGAIAIAEVFVNIHHMLVANPGTKVEEVTRVYSHPQALGQCRDFLSSRRLDAIQATNTAGAVKMIKEEGWKDAAAIAGEEAAKLYGMDILGRNIEDRGGNCTRFLIITRADNTRQMREELGFHALTNGGAESSKNGKYKTSLVFGLHHTVGALHTVLEKFAKYGANLTQINSRPTRERQWEYVFHVDFEGHIEDPKYAQMLVDILQATAFLKVIGSYGVVYSENGH